jgi:Phosphotransferase enzyme family
MSLVENIKRAYHAEDHSASVRLANEVPPFYASLTKEWFTDVICQSHPGAKVVDFSLDERDDGSSNRQRISLSYNRQGLDAGLPVNLFCKASENLATRVVLGASGAGATEVNFHNKVRSRLVIEAPIPVYAGYDPDSYASFVMLENLEGKVEFINERKAMSTELVLDQVGLLARLHSRVFQSPELGSETLPFPAWPAWPAWWANMMHLFPGFSLACKQAFEDCEDLMPARLFARRHEFWDAIQKSIESHLRLPHTLIHCDVHLKNWYIVDSSGRMGLGDWQNVTIGHWSRDFIYAVTTALSIDDRRKYEHDFLQVYLENFHEHSGLRVSESEAWQNIRQQLLSAMAFWAITLNPDPEMAKMQPKRTSQEFLSRLFTAMDDHDALDSFD